MKAFIPAAGIGARLQPLTHSRPKALVEVAGRPMLEWLMLKLISSGIDEVIVNLHHFPQQIRDFFQSRDNFGIRIEFSDESDLLLDTGGGLWKAAWFFDDGKPFLVHNADILSDASIAELSAHHAATRALATLVVQERNSSRQLLWDATYHLAGWENSLTGEKKMVSADRMPAHRMAFNGIHVIDPEIFKIYPRQGVFSIIDVYLELASGSQVNAMPFLGNYWIDVGKPQNLAAAAEILKRMHNLP